MKTIRSRDNPLLKQLIKLANSSRERRASGTTILDGDHLIQAYADARLKPLELIAASEAGLQREPIRKLMEHCQARARVVIDDRLLALVSQVVTPSGVLALVKTPIPPLMPPRIGDALYLEEIQDPGNLGSILRTALAAGIRSVYLSRGSVFAWSPKVIRAGMGAHFYLSIFENVDLAELGRRAGCRILATLSNNGTSIDRSDLAEPSIWMFGNEGAGLSSEAQSLADLNVTIPMVGNTDSLNVAAAVAICLFEQLRQRRGR